MTKLSPKYAFFGAFLTPEMSYFGPLQQGGPDLKKKIISKLVYPYVLKIVPEIVHAPGTKVVVLDFRLFASRPKKKAGLFFFTEIPV